MTTTADVFPDFLLVSPFGPFCRECCIPLSVERGIYSHGKTSHPMVSIKNASLVREVKRQMTELRIRHSNDLSPFLQPGSKAKEMWFCAGCFVAYGKLSNYKRHFESRCNKDCVDHGDKKMFCYDTICGRFGPATCTLLDMSAAVLPPPSIITNGTTISSLSHSQGAVTIHDASSNCKVPPALMTTEDEANKILEPFVRQDENVTTLSLIFLPLLSPAFEGTMREYIQYSNQQSTEEDIVLNKWINAGKLWLTKYAAGHIANVSANVRHRLAVFEQQDVDGTMYGTTFNLRRNIPRLVSELRSALRFFYRFPTSLFDEFKSDDVKNADEKWMIERAIIPRILYTAAKEEPTDHGQLPVACRYCLSRGFGIQDQTKLVMYECGWFSSRISAVMHLLRAGVCGYLVTFSVEPGLQVLSLQELEVVRSIQDGRVTNMLAPYVKKLREMNARKAPGKHNTVNANGDITSCAFVFPKSVWSTMIPRIVEISKACFAEVFVGITWQHFLTLPISMTDFNQLEASVATTDMTISLKDLNLQENIDNLLGLLQSIGELCLFGFGVGAVRHEEVIRLKLSSFQWHNSYVYYWTESLKQGSLKTRTTPNMVEHRLSLSLSRIFLLLRYCFVKSGNLGPMEVLPSLPGASMLFLVRDIFDFDIAPQMLNVRHLFTSIGNVVLPEKTPGEIGGPLVSDISMTEKSGHTQGTGRRAYGTYLENSDELLYDLYHRSLGEISLDPPVLAFTPFSDSVLEAGLKELLGRQASFRSREQKRMIDISANCVTRHSYVGIPCGHGKSLSWLVPVIASFLTGRSVGLRIVILPYKFLLGHMVEQARSMIGMMLADRIRVEFVDSSGLESVSKFLEEKSVPALLFLNLDSAASLLKLHLVTLQKLAAKRVLHRIYVDEFQQLIVEFGFRSCYQTLRELGRIGAPVMCLSGSMPFSMATSLMSYCRLLVGYTLDSVEIVQGFDPIGSGFFFDVKVVQNLETSIVESVLTCMDSACHVICDTKVLVDKVGKLLSNRCNLLSVTGDTPSHEQMQCARDWASGTYDVLVSSTVALVGNENKKCRKIVVGGFLYNVSSLVQAIGRLRPPQRGPGAVVEVLHLPFNQKVLKDANETEVNSFRELVSATCLKEDCRDDYSKIFSPVGLQNFLLTKEGCYLQTLSSYYGYARCKCMNCQLCHTVKKIGDDDTSRVVSASPQKRLQQTGSPESNKRGKLYIDSNVETAMEYAAEASHEEKRIRRLADNVFRELLFRCVLCGEAACIGECGRWCYRCGDRYHSTNSCSFTPKKVALILANKGVCYGCYDTRQRGTEYHKMKDCPLRRRLKRLLFVDREKRNIQFEDYLRLIYADEITFLKVVSSFSEQVTLGRYVLVQGCLGFVQ